MQTLVTLRQLGIAVDENNANPDGWITINAPHRADTNPSFAININHGGWTDNGTRESGDIYSLVQLVNPGMNFPEAKAFVDGKGAKKKLQMKQSNYFGDLNSPFWTDGRKSTLASAQERLEKANDSKILKDLLNYDGLTKETLQHFECGLVNWEFVPDQPVVTLLIPYPTGAQLYARGKDGKMIQMFTGSKPAESFFGASKIKKNKELIICKSPREAMIAQQKLGDRFDCVGICSGESDKLSEQQSSFLKAKVKYYKRVFVCFDRDTIPAEEIAFGFARKVCDAIGTLKRDVRLSNIGKLTQNECKDLTDLFKSSHKSKVLELFSENSFEFSEYIWNSWTEEYRFWDVTEKGALAINEVKFARVLGKFGFKKSYFAEADEPTLVQDIDNILHNVSSHQLSDFVLDEILEKLSKYVDIALLGDTEKLIPLNNLQKVFFKYRDKVLSNQIKAIFRQKPIKIMTDSPTEGFLFFKNGTVKVTKDSLEVLPYEQIPSKIWKSQIMPRTFSETAPSGTCDLEVFVENVASQDPAKKRSFMSALGYLLHSYKNKANSPAIILIDEKSSPNMAQGGTGKSLFAQSIKHIRNQRYMAGKNVDPSSKFFFMDAQMGDQSLFFDDVKHDFDFEALFNVITDDMQIEAKYKNRFTIPFELSPKIILATNSVVQGFGNSFKRRQFTLPFSDHYLKNPVPQAEFGRKLFDDWDDEEWARYDHFMIRCLQLYLEDGLVKFPTDHFLVRTLTVNTSPDFYDWADTNLETGVEYSANVLFDGLDKISNGSNPSKVSPTDSNGNKFPCFSDVSNELMNGEFRTFMDWLRQFASYKQWQLGERLSNGYKVVKFTKK
ncbi:MAG: hypothetical protein JJ892_11935 [Balneola sp.]|nr:hypothetical protein [Balneola sp.]MBO6651435.1 hypothetical protein [Balneola sp.]MBO6712528.1 hypothetical protein [Balneola sp.]MBO6800979.1 hypothetical protein [Balneola sp.]MBO6870651.1 hypothetical protein [Balneola sp.]